MCFGRSLKGDADPAGLNDHHLNARPHTPSSKAPAAARATSAMPDPPAGPPPSYSNLQSNNPYASAAGPPPSAAYAPPPGPPPSQAYAPPPGPPPSQAYAPPPGPPPSHSQYEPPSGPPPSQAYAPPPGPPPSQPQAPYHDWQSAVPDTTLLPPPPSMGEDRSWSHNASESDADRGAAWCASRPLLSPAPPSSTTEAVESGLVDLMRPAQYIGSVRAVRRGVWACASQRGSPDSCLMSTAPLYSARAHSPATFRRAKTVYFEVALAPGGREDEVGVALGFVAQPYPPFRLPGWERASVGVHGDDGRRYVNDCWGGKEFTSPLRPGEVVGLGMVFAPRKAGGLPGYGEEAGGIDVEVFFTRDGEKVGGWDLHEEADASQDRPVTGLEGAHDLFAAVGTFEKAEFEVRFDERDWLYRP